METYLIFMVSGTVPTKDYAVKYRCLYHDTTLEAVDLFSLWMRGKV